MKSSEERKVPAGRLVQALCFVLFFSVMNATMFNVALPDIANQFELLPSAVSWIVTGYAVIYALGSLLFGKLADKYPLRLLITVGLLLFAAGSAIGFFANSYAIVLISRYIQASGASCVPALVMLIPIRFFPQEQRGKVMGVIASTIAFSSGVGPIVGGFIAGHFHWSGLFLISLFAPVALPFIRKALPDEEVRSGERVDLIGAGLLGVGVTALMLSVTQFNGLWLAASAVMAFLFIMRMRKTNSPFIRLSLFRTSGFAGGLIAGFVAMFVVFGVFLITPIMLREMHGLNAQTIGFVLFPAAMLAAVMGRFGGRLTDSRGSRYTLFLAFIVLSLGLLGLSAVTGLSPWVIAIVLPLINMSFTFAQAALAKTVSSSLPKEQTGIGMGIYNLLNFLAGAISGAIVSKAAEFDWRWLNVTAIEMRSTFGSVYFLLAFIVLFNIAWVAAKVEKEQPLPALRAS
ncbi:MFS transporter [Paenibacillus tarimensis]